MQNKKMNIAIHTLNSIGCPILESDYAYYGGTIVRDKPPARGWEDCSSCRFFAPIHNRKTGRADTDFGVCLNQHGPRAGLFTFEHQAGFSCYQPDEDEAQANINPLAFAAIGNKPDEKSGAGPRCAWGCKYFLTLHCQHESNGSADFGVCRNPASQQFCQLTHKLTNGENCFRR